jgi:recombination protein RecT
MSNQPLAPAQQRKDIRDMLTSPANLAEMQKVLPKHLTPERMVRVALTAFLKTPKLIECSRESLTQALMTCSQAGLEPDGRLAHLIPYGNVCQVIFDWKGIVALGLRNGFTTIYADVVFDKDDFDAGVENGVKVLRHRPNWRGDRGEPILVYCVAMKGGILDYEVMSIEETEAIRVRSKAGKSGPWVTDPLEMRKKTVIRRMSKRWDLMPEIRDVVYADDDTPPGIGQEPPKMARPIFSMPDRSLSEPAAGPGPQPIEAEAAVPIGQPETEVPSDGPSMSQDGDKAKVVRDLLKLCTMSNVTVAETLAWLEATGQTDGSQGSLDEVFIGVLQTTVAGWIGDKKKGTSGIVDAIKGAKA